MLNFIFAALLQILPANVAPAQACETYAPRLDGISVTVCDGAVVSRCDASGNCN